MPYDIQPLPFRLGEIDFASAVFETWLKDDRDRHAAQRYLTRPSVLIGAGSILAQDYVAQTIAGGHVIALLDNARAGQVRDGIPVIGDSDLAAWLDRHPDAIGVLCCGSEGAINHFRRLWGERSHPLLSWFELLPLWPADVSAGHRVANLPGFSDLDGVRAAHQSARRVLSDAISLQTLDAIMLYRLTWDLRYLIPVARPEKAIYFEADVMPLGEREVLVDGGAFDGDTVRDFVAKTAGSYSHIHAFELDPANAAAFNAKTAGIRDVTLHSLGLWDGPAELGIEHRPDNGSRVSEDADLRVPLDALDNIDVGRPTLIKLDVEGAEVEALTGALRTIRDGRPKLAVCAYHKPDDFVTIIDRIQSLRDDYQFSLRHYSPILYDSVLFCT
ncbi:MAG: FkbM family methyltransferase [Asticcacaulis sp.]|nr:FkbM family methyltransferase [Asticcacaulis sp.]